MLGVSLTLGGQLHGLKRRYNFRVPASVIHVVCDDLPTNIHINIVRIKKVSVILVSGDLPTFVRFFDSLNNGRSTPSLVTVLTRDCAVVYCDKASGSLEVVNDYERATMSIERGPSWIFPSIHIDCSTTEHF